MPDNRFTATPIIVATSRRYGEPGLSDIRLCSVQGEMTSVGGWNRDGDAVSRNGPVAASVSNVGSMDTFEHEAGLLLAAQRKT